MSRPNTSQEPGRGPGYLDWEGYQASLKGLRALSVAGGVGCGTLLIADLLLFPEGRPFDLVPGALARAALALGLLAAAGVGTSTLGKRGEVQQPLWRAGVLTLLLVCVGALAAAAAGGVDGYYPFGLLPLLMVWTAAMPAGSGAAAVPLLGGLALHLIILRITAADWGPRGVGAAVFFILLVGSALAISEVLERQRRLRVRDSRLDPLTGVLHRQGLLNELKLLCSRRVRMESSVSIVLFDLDRFRLINAAHGRSFGDQVLEMIGALVRGSVRAHDLVGRYGSDEFMLVLDGCDGEHAIQLIERIRVQLAERPIPVAHETLRVTMSAGIISAAAGALPTPEELVQAAERALIESKNAQLSRTVLGPLTESQANGHSRVAPAVVWNFPPPPARAEDAGPENPTAEAGANPEGPAPEPRQESRS
jgi:diguanylate cyclase (GGDEF)-like protein